jgi:hypothetical protein
MDQCEVSMKIPFNPTEPWLGSIIGSEPDTATVALPRRYSSTAYHATPDSESGEPHMAAAS